MKRLRHVAVVAASVVLATALVFSIRDSRPEVAPEVEFANSYCEIGLRHAVAMYEIRAAVLSTPAAPGYKQGWLPLYTNAQRARLLALDHRRDVLALRLPETPRSATTAKMLEFHANDPLTVTRDIIEWIGSLPRDLTARQSARSLKRLDDRLVFALGDFTGGSFALLVPEFADAIASAESCMNAEAELAREVRD